MDWGGGGGEESHQAEQYKLILLLLDLRGKNVFSKELHKSVYMIIISTVHNSTKRPNSSGLHKSRTYFIFLQSSF